MASVSLVYSSVALLSWVLLFSVGSGCVSDPKPKPRPHPSTNAAPAKSGIQEINLLAIPVALNFDEKPGLDGFIIKVYAGNRRQPKPLPIENGQIEILMYDGIPGVTEGASLQPRKQWTYTADELRHYEIRSSIGMGYQFSPMWGDAQPVNNKIAVVVRYTSANGSVITSAPSFIAVTLN